MDPKVYRQLQTIFSEFNEAIIKFYTDLSELVPHYKVSVLYELHRSLESTNQIFREVTDVLYKS